MLDPVFNRWLKQPARFMAGGLNRIGLSADHLTVVGFIVGIGTIPALAYQHNYLALALILVNRLLDGLDGALARMTSPTDAGGFLDITLDFIFYSGVVFGFALFDPGRYALYAALLIFSFMGTGASFLAFAVLAEKKKIKSVTYPHKSLYYLGGLTEGSETIIFFVFICLFPRYFIIAVIVFSILCWMTTCFRIVFGYLSLK